MASCCSGKSRWREAWVGFGGARKCLWVAVGNFNGLQLSKGGTKYLGHRSIEKRTIGFLITSARPCNEKIAADKEIVESYFDREEQVWAILYGCFKLEERYDSATKLFRYVSLWQNFTLSIAALVQRTRFTNSSGSCRLLLDRHDAWNKQLSNKTTVKDVRDESLYNRKRGGRESRDCRGGYLKSITYLKYMAGIGD